jgi:hypothetical protein
MASKHRFLAPICCSILGAVLCFVAGSFLPLWHDNLTPSGDRRHITLWQLVKDDWTKPPPLSVLWDGIADTTNFDPIFVLVVGGAVLGLVVYLLVRVPPLPTAHDP